MTLTHLSDFPDRISPMLVKELRQGLRAKTFIAVFLSLQAALCLILLASTLSSTSSDAVGQRISTLIFTFFAFAVLLVQPLRGINAVSLEVKSNTLDMMALTRLDASRIVFGKWVAIVSQTAILLVTVIPYLVLRYFFGGMNIFAEIFFLFLLFATSMAVTAVTVGISATSSIILRNILPLLGAMFLAYGILFAMFSGLGVRSLSVTLSPDSRESWIGALSYLAAIAYVGWSALKAGALIISPPADNLSTRHRLIVLSLAILAFIVTRLDSFDGDMIPAIFGVLVAPAFAIALSESSVILPPVRESFARRGILGKITGAFLLPGWRTGILFTLALAGIFLAACAIRPGPAYLQGDDYIVIFAILGSLLFPAVICNLFLNSEQNRLSAYLLISLASAIFAMVTSAIAEGTSHSILWLFIWNPPSFLGMINSYRFTESTVLAAAAGVCLVYFAILAIRSLILAIKNRANTPDSEPEPET